MPPPASAHSPQRSRHHHKSSSSSQAQGAVHVNSFKSSFGLSAVDFEGHVKLISSEVQAVVDTATPDGWKFDIHATCEVGAGARATVTLTKQFGEVPAVQVAPEMPTRTGTAPTLFRLVAVPHEDVIRFTDDDEEREKVRTDVGKQAADGDFLDEAACLRFRAASGVREPCLPRFVALMFRAVLANLQRKHADEVWGGFCNGHRLTAPADDKYILASTLEQCYRVRDTGFAVNAGDLAARLRLDLPDNEHLKPVQMNPRRERASRRRKIEVSGFVKQEPESAEDYVPPPPPPAHMQLLSFLRERFVEHNAIPDKENAFAVICKPFLIEKLAMLLHSLWEWTEQKTWETIETLVEKGYVVRDDHHPLLLDETPTGGWRRAWEFYLVYEYLK